MPNIPQLTSDVGGFQLSDRGDQANNMAARRIGIAYDQSAANVARTGAELGSAVKSTGNVIVDKIAQEDISAGAAAGAKLFSDLNDSKDAAIKAIDPKDPLYGQKVESAVKQWREQQLEPALDKFRGGFLSENGGKWAERWIDTTRQHMYTSSHADVMTAAGIGIHNAINETVTLASNTAARDPSSTQAQLDLVEHSIDGMVEHSPVKGTAAAALRSEMLEKGKAAIVKAAAFGAIQRSQNPEATAEEWTAKYPTLINGAEVRQLATYAHAQQRANLLTEKQLEQYQIQQDTRAAHVALSKNWTDSVTFDENGKATIKPDFYKNVMAIETQHPGVATERAKAMIGFGQTQQREKRETIITDKATQAKLYDGLFDPDNPTTDVDILKAANEDKLDAHATTMLLQLSKALEETPLKGPRYQGTMAAVKEIYGTGELGHQAYANFLQSFLPDYLAKNRAGTLPGNALDTRDPNSMISQAMAPYRLTPTQKMFDAAFKRYGMGGDMAQGVPGLTPPTESKTPKPGEVVKGYKFRGGDPTDPKNWEKVH